MKLLNKLVLVYALMVVLLTYNTVESKATPKNTTVTGYAWIDANMNGISNNVEDYLGNINVRLFKGSGELLKEVNIEAKWDAFTFKDLPEGRYCVITNDTTGKYVNGPLGENNKLGTWDPAYCFDLPSYVDPFPVTLGFVDKSLANVVVGNAFLDLNGNGVQDPQEGFLDGINVTLKSADGKFSKEYAVESRKNGLEMREIISGIYCLHVRDTTDRYEVGAYGPARDEGNMVDQVSSTYCLNIPDENCYIYLAFQRKIDFKSYSIRIYAFKDKNKDGEDNDGPDQYLGGIAVKFKDALGALRDFVLQPKADSVVINDLPPGKYCLTSKDPSQRYVHSRVGKSNKLSSDYNVYCFTLPQGDIDPFVVAFGYY
eukprot:gene2278-2584_t